MLTGLNNRLGVETVDKARCALPPNEAVRAVLASEMSPVERGRSLAEEAADQLRDLILLEKLAPGAAIPERDLAEALGVSRTPLREAMRMLEHEGLVEYSRTRRPFVAAPPLAEILQNLQVLGALEALAGEQACTNAAKDEITDILALAELMERVTDTAEPLEFFGTDMKFHRAIVAASGNAPLLETHRMYNARLWRARFISSRQRRNRDNTLREHREIADALAERDAERCAHALKAHLASAGRNIAEREGASVG